MMMRRIFYLIVLISFSCIQLIESTEAPSCVAKDGEKCVDEETDEDEEAEWWEGDVVELEEIWDEIECDEVLAETRPIHNLSTWMLLRGAYRATMGPKDSTIPIQYTDGFTVKYEVRHSEKGRGVYALEPVKKGTLVWDVLNVACFDDAKEYLWFLGSIPEDLACDVFVWAYVGTGEMCVDLDEGSFINTAGGSASYESNDIKPNLGYSRVEGVEGQFALRDIKAGEEFLTNYDTFDSNDGWKQFGLGRWEDE